jgi:Ca2+-binding RTX toxin-like protein
VSVDLGDGDDRATIRWLPGTGARRGSIAVAGGAGDDRIENLAGDGFMTFTGGDGNDTLLAGASGGGFLLGGAGADLMASSASCCMTTGYGDHDRTGVRVTLDEQANDGVAGEGDDVRTIDVVGSPGPDAITGDARGNKLTGSGGADVLDGADGDDTIDATLPYGAEADEPDGSDTVTCGGGDDHVVADENDTVGLDCETTTVGGGAVVDLGLDLGAARAARNGSVKLAYRAKSPSPGNEAGWRSTFRLVDRKGRAASSTARFVLSDQTNVASVRVRLNRATRRRLARSRAGALGLIAQRVTRSAGPTSTGSGYGQYNTPVTIRRARKRGVGMGAITTATGGPGPRTIVLA